MRHYQRFMRTIKRARGTVTWKDLEPLGVKLNPKSSDPETDAELAALIEKKNQKALQGAGPKVAFKEAEGNPPRPLLHARRGAKADQEAE